MLWEHKTAGSNPATPTIFCKGYMMERSSGGIGFVGLLTILFIGLKLTGYITWSWWWVLSPLWIPFVLAVLFLLTVLVLGGTVKIKRKS